MQVEFVFLVSLTQSAHMCLQKNNINLKIEF